MLRNGPERAPGRGPLSSEPYSLIGTFLNLAHLLGGPASHTTEGNGSGPAKARSVICVAGVVGFL